VQGILKLDRVDTPSFLGVLVPDTTTETSPLPVSGYTPCGCRDCPDVTVSGNTSKPELCGNCIDADCLPYSPEDEREGVPSYSYDCQRDPISEETP
jgi:hypothetical protein